MRITRYPPTISKHQGVFLNLDPGSRVTLDAGQQPHWVALDLSGTRIVLNSDEQGPDHRLFIVNFDPNTGAAKLDERFRDGGSDHPGVSMHGKSWSHGFHGNAFAHGTVFSS